MKKAFAAVLAVSLLSGCGSQIEIPQRVMKQLNAFAQESITVGSNRHKGYYSYYLPKGVGQRDSNELSEVLIKDGYRVVMNFDPSTIVIKNYYEEKAETETQEETKPETSDQELNPSAPQMDKQDTKIIYRGSYRNAAQEIMPYTLQLLPNNGYDLLYLDGSLIKLYAYVPKSEVMAMLRMMFTIMGSVEYDETKILQDYSLKQLTQTKKKNLDYLEQNIPSSGSLEDLLKENDDQQEDIGLGDATEDDNS